MATSVPFKDLNEYDGKTFYGATNESLKAWDKVLDGVNVKRAAGICSGGEVVFFRILPRVEERLTLVDHCYASLYYAIGKYGTICNNAAKKAHEMLTERQATGSSELLGKEFEKANKGLPMLENDNIKKRVRGYAYSPTSTPRISNHMFLRDVSEKDVSAFKRARNKVEFLHGDIRDLIDLGPFDLLYLSNALDYLGRGGVTGDGFGIEKIVSPGGYVAYTCQRSAYPSSSYYSNSPTKSGRGDDMKPGCVAKWDVVAEQYDVGSLSWNHVLCRTPQ